MTRSAGDLLFWAPRVLAILFALFLSLFALDVFTGAQGFLETAAALFMHLIPAFAVVVLLVLAWRWEWVGVIAFAVLAIIYVSIAWGRFHWSAYAAISGPLMLIAVLFLLSRLRRFRARQPGK